MADRWRKKWINHLCGATCRGALRRRGQWARGRVERTRRRTAAQTRQRVSERCGRAEPLGVTAAAEAISRYGVVCNIL